MTVEVGGDLYHAPSFSDEDQYGVIVSYFVEYTNSNQVQELINAIEEVMNSTRQPFADALQSMVECRVGIMNSEFFDVWEGVDWNQPDLVIPTIDLRDMLIEWKNFIESKGE